MFKKIIVAISCLATILLCFCVNSRPVFEAYTNEFIVYATKNSSNGDFIKSNRVNYPFIFNKFGESFTITNKAIDLKDFINEFSAKLIFSEKTEQGTSYYFYSQKIKYLQFINGNKINLHIFVGNDKVKIGSPIIYDSY